MIEARYGFSIGNVPDKQTVNDISQAISDMLVEKFSTYIYIVPEVTEF